MTDWLKLTVTDLPMDFETPMATVKHSHWPRATDSLTGFWKPKVTVTDSRSMKAKPKPMD